MHKSSYASGFLYHSASQQILLQQTNQNHEDQLVMFGAKSHPGKDPRAVFKSCVEEALGVSLADSAIHPVYDYVHDQLGAQFIFFVEMSGPDINVDLRHHNAAWLMLSKLSKCNMSEQTRHDITIGGRVIRSLAEPAQPPRA
jgi:hypothetical protein